MYYVSSHSLPADFFSKLNEALQHSLSERGSESTDSPSVPDPWEGSCEKPSCTRSEETQPTKSSSTKTNPEHYRRGSIEPWDFVAAQGLDFFLGNAVKYITRAGHKEGESAEDDLRKAIVYLEKKLTTITNHDAS
jgi:hypothetical protein